MDQWVEGVSFHSGSLEFLCPLTQWSLWLADPLRSLAQQVGPVSPPCHPFSSDMAYSYSAKPSQSVPAAAPTAAVTSQSCDSALKVLTTQAIGPEFKSQVTHKEIRLGGEWHLGHLISGSYHTR